MGRRCHEGGASCGISACWLVNWPLYTEGKERVKKGTEHARLEGGRRNEQGSLHTRLVWGVHKTSRSLHLLPGVFKVYIEDFTGFRPVYVPDDFNTTLLTRGCALETSFHSGNCGQNIHSKDRGGG